MKSFKVLTAILLAGSVFYVSCSKNDSNPQTTTSLVQAKWSLDKDFSDQYYSGTHNYDTTYGVPGDYADFRADGKLYTSQGSQLDTSFYEIVGNNRMTIWTDPNSKDTFDIQTLTTSQMVLHSKTVYASNYYEETIQLTK